MKWMGFAVGVAATIIGAIIAHLELGNFFHGVQVGTPYWTITAITIGGLAALLQLWKAKIAGFVLLAVAIFGVFGNYVMWEGPGTFYLVSALMAFQSSRQGTDETEEVVSAEPGHTS